MNRKYLLLICMICSLSTSAQSVAPQLDTLLRNTLDSMRTLLNNKSLSAAIQIDANTSWSYATGVSEENPNVYVTPDHVYEIGSVTKTMTAGAILKLVDQGILNLDDSIHQWLPPMNFVDSNITIRQLLRHQSGLYDVLANPSNQPTLLNDMNKIWTPQELIDTFLMAPLAAPGGTWNYCNTNYFLLAMIIKAATGQEYHQLIRSNFFTSLQLNDIAIPAFETLSSNVAHVWIDLNGDNIVDDAHNLYFNWLSLNSTAGAAGGYYATAKDVSKWMRAYMRGDFHSPVVMQEAKSTITAPGLPGGTYGLGLMKKTFLGLDGYGHGGDLSYSSSSWYFPSKDISISVLNNDSRKISWDLISTVTALLKTYNNWLILTAVNTSTLIESGLKIFPSPCSNNLHLRFVANKGILTRLLIINAFGQLVQSQSIVLKEGVNQIDVQTANLPNGYYTIHIQDEHQWIQDKFVVQHLN
ncbi:MAG: serine hydrolase [Chitinophagaceae bacterium]|nr:serine hydrolase [Chitinophagaceae bacterium]